MNATATEAKFVQMPAALLGSVRRALVSDREPFEAVTLLRQVGYDFGGAVFDALGEHVSREHGGVDAGSLDPDRFWASASGYFEGLGWGRVEHRRLHPGVGALDLEEWMESGSDGGPPGAHLSTGIFTDLLVRLADAPVTVMEVPNGEGRTRLLFGSQEALGAVYEAIRGGATPDEAISGLG